MRTIFFILTILILNSTYSIGQEQHDHLEPAEDFSKTEGMLKDYYVGILELLNKGLINKPIARYTVLPSFGLEYSLSLEKVNSNKFKLISRKCSENYWYAEKKNKVKIVENIMYIDNDFTNLIKGLFDKITNQITETKRLLAGLDGVTYYFSVTKNNGQLITGTTWSPDKGTKMERLVLICEDIKSFVTDSSKTSNSISQDIQDLLKKLN